MTGNLAGLELATEQLRWQCDPAALPFSTTDDVAPMGDMVGQDRAIQALALAFDLESEGFNVYVAGIAGTGRSSAVYREIEKAMQGRPAPPDWCYLHNFDDPHEPIAVRLPSGRGPELARDLDRLIAQVRDEIPRTFNGDQYAQRRLALVQAIQTQREAVFGEMHHLAEQLGFNVEFGPNGIAVIPRHPSGEAMSPEAYQLLPDEKQAELRSRSQDLERRLDEMLLVVRRIEREGWERMRALAQDTALAAIGPTLEALRNAWRAEGDVLRHLIAVQEDLIAHLDQFESSGPRPDAPSPYPVDAPSYVRYQANVLTTHDANGGPPVVFEPNPTYYNLVGRVEYRPAMGTMHTDFTLINPGALHRANGGYLVLQARDLLMNPFAWDALKRCLRDREIRIENLGEQLSSVPTASLKPNPIPLAVKVVLIGDVATYAMLHQLDEDFRKYFKIKAEFSPTIDRSAGGVDAYAAFISGQIKSSGLLPMSREAVAEVVEQGARLAEHQERLTARFGVIADLVIEATHCARVAGADQVLPRHVAEALAQQQQRLNLIESEIQRMIDERTVAIATTGEAIGQVNGLSVIDTMDYAFGRPSRITARVGVGTEGVVDIEREVKLSGPSHSKGVMILSGYLLGCYARRQPLTLAARLTFEQVYSEVDGDSASSTELYALLSALAELPIKQGIAVTGSVNQVGEIQAVGGVTAKIEGFFAVCQAQGLTGDQGVIIPRSNLVHLMLKPEILRAVEAGQFHVWAVRTVDEGIELLTGVPAGTRSRDGSYEAGSVHARVQRRLESFSSALTRFRPRQATRRGRRLVTANAPNGPVTR